MVEGASRATAAAIRNQHRFDQWLDNTHRRVEVAVTGRAGLGWPLDRFLAGLCPSLSRALFHRWIGAGHVLVDGLPARQRQPVAAGQTISVRVPLPPLPTGQLPPPPLEVLHREAGFLIVNKPPGQLAHPAGAVLSGTVLNQVMALLEAEGRDPRQARLVNRIDRDTSGILLIGLDDPCQRSLCTALQRGGLVKEYLALVHGRVPVGHGHWREPIGPGPASSIARVVGDHGQRAETEWWRVEAMGGAHALLRLRLHTGRQHQIRVHAAHHGLPLVGDWVYGRPCAELPGQALHSARLVLPHPQTGQRLEVRAPPPPALAGLCERLRRGGAPTPRPWSAEELGRLGRGPAEHVRTARWPDLDTEPT